MTPPLDVLLVSMPFGPETVRQFAFVDAVVAGEADHVFADLAERVVRGEPTQRPSCGR